MGRRAETIDQRRLSKFISASVRAQGKTRHWKQSGSRASKVKVSKKDLEKLRRVNEAIR